MGVKRDDVVGGEFLLAGTGRPAIGQVDLVLGGVGPEPGFRRPMGADTGRRSPCHALDLVGGLCCPGVIQHPHQGRRIMVAQAVRCGHWLGKNRPTASGAHLAAQFRGGAHDHQVVRADPIALRQRRGQIPVIVWLVEYELRAVARPIDHEAVRAGIGQPGPVPRIGPERVAAVVQVEISQAAGADDQAVIAACGQGAVGPAHDLPEVVAVEVAECLFRHSGSCPDIAGSVAADGPARHEESAWNALVAFLRPLLSAAITVKSADASKH
jgi:hypothetical protein